MIKGAIFDLDGTLLDSMFIWDTIGEDYLRSLGKEPHEDLKETGEAILDGVTGLVITRARLGNVTFWVKYTETETGYLVHRAYSHRMTIQTR